MGKLLPEERTDTVTARNIAYFTQFKSAHRDKLAFLHYNGRARLPQYRTTGWSAADWLYLQGTASTAPIGSTDQTVTVADTGPFSIAPDAFGHPTSDLVIRMPSSVRSSFVNTTS